MTPEERAELLALGRELIEDRRLNRLETLALLTGLPLVIGAALVHAEVDDSEVTRTVTEYGLGGGPEICGGIGLVLMALAWGSWLVRDTRRLNHRLLNPAKTPVERAADWVAFVAFSALGPIFIFELGFGWAILAVLVLGIVPPVLSERWQRPLVGRRNDFR